MPGSSDAATPALSIDLPEADRTNGAHTVEARWSDDGGRILVSRTVDPRAWPLLDAARPDIGALVLAIGMLAMFVGIPRILRRPRTAGRAYCRRCNHDLDAAVGTRPRSPRCPECGAALDGHGVVRGATAQRRLTRVLVPGVAAVLAGGALFVTSVSPRQAWFGGPSWPVASAATVRGWPWWRRSTLEQPERPMVRVDSIRVDRDGLRLESPVLMPGLTRWIAHPDGGVIAWIEYSQDTGWTPRAAWFDMARGVAGSADLGDTSSGFPSLCGWSPDGREIIALLQRTSPQPYAVRDDGSGIVTADVLAVRTDTGAVRTVGTGRGRATGGGGVGGGWLMGPATAAIGNDPQARTVTLAAEQPRNSAGGVLLHELTVIGDSGVRIIPLPGVSIPDTWGFHEAWMTADGRIAIEFESPWSGVNPQARGGPTRFIDLATGAVSEAPSGGTGGDEASAGDGTAFGVPAAPRTSGKASPDGSRWLRIETDWSAPDRIARLRLLVDRAGEAGGATDAPDAPAKR